MIKIKKNKILQNIFKICLKNMKKFKIENKWKEKLLSPKYHLNQLSITCPEKLLI
jgi:CRISPR/Cas system-associated protein endoribonuclease Cas2